MSAGRCAQLFLLRQLVEQGPLAALAAAVDARSIDAALAVALDIAAALATGICGAT